MHRAKRSSDSSVPPAKLNAPASSESDTPAFPERAVLSAISSQLGELICYQLFEGVDLSPFAMIQQACSFKKPLKLEPLPVPFVSIVDNHCCVYHRDGTEETLSATASPLEESATGKSRFAPFKMAYKAVDNGITGPVAFVEKDTIKAVIHPTKEPHMFSIKLRQTKAEPTRLVIGYKEGHYYDLPGFRNRDHDVVIYR